MRYFIIFLLIVFLVTGCKNKNSEANDSVEISDMFTLLDSTSTGINFVNHIKESEQFNFLIYEYLHNGGGVAIGDINNDGLSDIYFSGNMVFNKLYLNLGDFKFKDITDSAGVNGGLGFKTGVTMADVNSDGFLDIYICKSALADPVFRKNVVYINNGDLTFTDKSAEYGLDDPSYSSQAYFFDMDDDGDQDMYLVNHPYNLRESNNINVEKTKEGKLEIAKPSSYTYISDRLYLNDNNRFKDVSAKAGVLNEAFGLSAAVGDFNGDFRPDIYVCNDYVKPDKLYINQGNGKFSDKFDDFFAHSSFSSMGSDFADINNDGCFDLMTLDMLPRDHFRQNMLGMAQNYDKFNKLIELDLKAQFSMNTLQLNNCNGKFSDIAFVSDVAMTDWSWSVLMADFDNDSYKDIFISNGYVSDVTNNDYARYTMDSLQKELNLGKITIMDWLKAIPANKIPSYFFRNNGDLTFKDVSEVWNSGGPAFSSGAAYADLDNDGYLDLVVSNINQSPFIMQNNGRARLKNNFVSLDFNLKKSKISPGIIAKAFLPGGKIITEHYSPTKGFFSSSQHRLHFGIGENTIVDSIQIFWHKNKIQTLSNPEINKVHKVTEQADNRSFVEVKYKPYFTDITKKYLAVGHQENQYIDFKREPLLHHKYSEEGPAAGVTDINGDGLDDLFIGGSVGYSGKLYVQSKNGNFKHLPNIDLENDKDHEDVSSVFFDADGDGDQDLYVVSGGNEFMANDKLYQDRLYLNDGKGNFSKMEGSVPEIFQSGSVVATNDIDQDGDIDLFIGSRVTPGRYPEPPQSYFLENKNGVFTIASDKWASDIDLHGMITDAVFADLDKDRVEELIFCGEWMSINVLKWSNGKFSNITKSIGLSEWSGWWNTIHISDLNGDGFPEIMAGNLGLNSQIKTSKQKPASLWFKDFDNNGSIDPILCYYNGDKSYPLHFRDRMLDQMIFLKKKFTRYQTYANATIADIFDSNQMKGAVELKANTFEHAVFINKAGKIFDHRPLPVYSQISSVQSIITDDLDKDGKPEIMLGGNFYGTDAQIGRYDASIGVVLKVNNQFEFEVMQVEQRGWSIPGNVRHIIPFDNKRKFWVVKNNDISAFIGKNDLN